MNSPQEVTEVRFTQETAAILQEENDPKYMLFKMALKLVKESKEAMLNLGEFTSVVMDDDELYQESREFYHYSKYKDLEYDMFMFIAMMSNLIDNRDKDNYILAGSNSDFKKKKQLMAFSTKKPINGSFMHTLPVEEASSYDTELAIQ